MIDDADTAARGGVSVDGKDASEVPFHRRGFFLRRNEQGLHRLEWRVGDRPHLLQSARRKTCPACSAAGTIGYIYSKAREEDRDGPLTWIWSIHGVPGQPPGMRGHG